MKRKVFSLCLCITLIFGCMAGCGNTAQVEDDGSTTVDVNEIIKNANPTTTADGKTILNIYAQYADDDTKVPYDYAVEKLAEAYPNVELNLVTQSQDDGATLQILSQTGQLPDIFQANTTVINMFKEKGQVLQLDDYAQSSGYLDKVFDSNKELVYSDDGHIYCFPYAGNEYVLWYYNKALFEECGLEVPKTYDDLLNCISVFKAKGIVPMALFGQEGWISTAMYDVIATRYIPEGIKGLDSKANLISEEGYLKAAKDLEKLAKAGMFESGVDSTDYDTASAMFLNGEAAMFLNGQWYIQDATTALGEDVDWMYYPSYNESAYESGMMAFSGGGSTSGYAVNAESPNAELATEVAEFLAEKYCEAKVMYRGNPLVALDTGAKPQQEYPTMMTKLSETIPEMTSTTKFTWGLFGAEFNDSIQNASKEIIAGKISADQFIGNVTQ